MKKKMTGKRIRQIIIHICVGFVDYVGVPMVIAFLSTFLQPLDPCENVEWQFIGRTMACVAIYEVIVIFIRKMQIDVRRDELLAVLSAYKLAALYLEVEDSQIYDVLSNIAQAQKDKSVMNGYEASRYYDNLMPLVATKKSSLIRQSIIYLEHSLETVNLFWNYTVFLRLLK